MISEEKNTFVISGKYKEITFKAKKEADCNMWYESLKSCINLTTEKYLVSDIQNRIDEFGIKNKIKIEKLLDSLIEEPFKSEKGRSLLKKYFISKGLFDWQRAIDEIERLNASSDLQSFLHRISQLNEF